MGSSLVAQIINFTSVIVIARIGGSNILGLLVLAGAPVYIVDAVVNASVGSSHIFFVNQDGNKTSQNGTLLLMVSIIKLLSFAIIALIAYYTSLKEDYGKQFFYLSVLVMTTSLTTIPLQIAKIHYNSLVKQMISNYPSLLLQFVNSASRISAILLFESVVAVGWASLFSTLLILPIPVRQLSKDFMVTRPSFDEIKEYFTKSMSFLSFTYTKLLPQQLDKIILSMFLGAAAVGSYSVADKIGSGIELVFISAAPVIFPLFTRALKANNYQYVLDSLRMYYLRLTIYILPFLGLAFYFADSIILHLFSSEFGNAINTLRILLINSFITLIGVPLSSIVLAQNKMRIANIINFCGLFTFVLLALTLNFVVPSIGIINMSLARLSSTLITTAAFGISCYEFMSKKMSTFTSR